MVNVFGKMLNNLKDESFVKTAAKSVPDIPIITPDFEKEYQLYQERAIIRAKKKHEELIHS